MGRPPRTPTGRTTSLPLGSWLADLAFVSAAAAIPLLATWHRGQVRVASDLLTFFMPNFAWWWQRPRWLGGWNPWIFAGLPANADPQLAPLHPLGLLYAWTDPVTAAQLDGWLGPALGGMGMLVYLRRVGCGRPAALTGALAFTLGGYIVGRAPHPGLLRATLAIPWALAAIETFAGAALVATLGAATALLMASGHPQGWAYGGALILAYALACGRAASPGRVAALGVGLALGVGAVAASLLPTMELALTSTRAGGLAVGYADPRMDAAALAALLVPYAHGGGIGPVYGTASEPLAGCHLVECGGYVGLLPSLLVLLGVASMLPRPFRIPPDPSSRNARLLRLQRFWLTVAALSVLLATGVLFGAGLPGLRGPARFLLWWSVAAPAAAALGLELLTHGTTGAPAETVAVRRTTRRAVVLCTVLLLAALVWIASRDPVAERATIPSFPLLALSTAALLFARRRRWAAWLGVALLAIDLSAFAAAMRFGATHDEIHRLQAIPRLLATTLAGLPTADPDRDRALVLPLLIGANWAPFAPVQLVQGYGPLLPARLALLLGQRRGDATTELGLVTDATLLTPRSQVLDLLRVRLLGAFRGADSSTGGPLEEASRWSRVVTPAPERLDLFENRRALPVAWIVHHVRVVPPDGALAAIRGSDGQSFDPRHEVLAERDILGSVADDGPESAAGAAVSSVDLVEYGEGHVRLVAAASAPGVLVTSDLHYPGWRATIDGRNVPVEVVNAGFHAVVVPAGRHQVVLRYQPWTGRIGLLVSCLSAAALLVAAAAPILALVRSRSHGGQ